MANFWLRNHKKKKCSYRPLTKWEIIVIDPHKIKGKGGSKRDLSVCIGSNCDDNGEAVEHVKQAYYDDKGELMRPRDIHYEPIGINVHDPEFQEQMDKARKAKPTPSTRVMIALHVTGFDQDPATVLKQLGIKSAERSWKTGEPKVTGSRLKHTENGFAIGIDQKQKTFEGRVLSAIKELHSRKDRLHAICGRGVEIELSIGAYIVGNNVPPFNLPKEAIRLLSDLGAEVDLDLYVLSDEDSTDSSSK
jgi:hypothetical protein